MNEYIKKEALMFALCKEIIGDGDYYNGKDDMQDEIRDMVSRFPAADVAPVRHGRWETIDASTWRWSHDGARAVHRVKYRHNECGRVVQKKEPYCPNCGCKMDLED